ncbi:ribosomal protein S18-alanine N-acetyltransferase [Sphingomonas edaphi]|uniref:Ribosomal-protein-alanine N-acetyltransferase n=1 Tax=Sphingomonas edaphi TaxID=2315689 RepID=A0A418Q014_9SPHN|nr:ribosomal protein S18-alanine N-acetyltransferase [Sphingomonas edaphi]RIX29308.1 ribosomal-protein-alanine N-acetyltransferase [Sphingomonas edaphi]
MATPAHRPPACRLRPGGVDDLDDVMRVMMAAFQPCFGEAWTRSQCAGILPMAGVTLTLAEDDDESALGFALARTIADEAELLLIAVNPSSQRRGVGQALLMHFIEQARQAGAETLHLEVRDNNPAIALYSAAGFRPAGRRRNYYSGADGTKHDAVTLKLVN